MNHSIRAGLQMSCAPSVVRGFNSSNCASQSMWTFLTVFVVLNVWNEWLRGTNDSGIHHARSFSQTSSYLLLVETIKLFLSLAYSLWQWRWKSLRYASTGPYRADEEGLVVAGPTDPPWPYSHGHESPRGFVEGMVAICPPIRPFMLAHVFFVATIFASHQYNVALARELTDPLTLYFALSVGTLCTLCLSYLVLLQSFSAIQWHAAMLQSCGFLVLQMWLVMHVSPHISYPILISSTLSQSISSVLCKHIYTTYTNISWYSLNNGLFMFGVIIRLLFYSASADEQSVRMTLDPHLIRTVIASAVQAVAELSVVAVVYFWDPVTQGVLSSTSIAVCVIFVSSWAGDSWLGVLLSCFLVISACAIYVFHQSDADDEQRHGKKLGVPFRRTVSAVALLSTTFYLAFTASHEWGSALHRPGKPVSVGDLVATSASRCTRRPLASWSYWPGERTFHAFDDVLLIVFFSHARYDANLDFYREVYSQFFPNIIFVGPGTREDKGFQHSYDVLVDSYQSDEDLSDPAFFKMAGRMAHHMLFTALKEYDCYDGYLWAPFDTLLNVPRLQQFDQRFFWYHSPAAIYVPNPALGDSAANANASRHAPPANISPDPYLDLASTWKGWGQDWWWGDPHVGLTVCMPAYHRVPPLLRGQLKERMRPYTNDTTRLIGGSADTLYIPGKHRHVFMDTLALFLETDCFLEIATPTTVHLVTPPDEPILFVDHWWIWQPPFNASYVRQMWGEGYEVDTFHTFHWGDRDATGVWRGNPAHIADVRMLLAESARRQGVDWPWTSASVAPPEAPEPLQ